MNTLQRWIRRTDPGQVQLHLVEALTLVMREHAVKLAEAAKGQKDEGK
jgi:hypothetical protein